MLNFLLLVAALTIWWRWHAIALHPQVAKLLRRRNRLIRHFIRSPLYCLYFRLSWISRTHENCATAWHEAGHLAALLLLQEYLKPSTPFAYILRSGTRVIGGGCVPWFYSDGKPPTQPLQAALANLVMTVAGTAAERLCDQGDPLGGTLADLTHERYYGAHDDRYHAEAIATIIRDEIEIGALTVTANELYGVDPHSPNFVLELLAATRREAREIVTKHREWIRRIAHVLIEQGNITGEQACLVFPEPPQV